MREKGKTSKKWRWSLLALTVGVLLTACQPKPYEGPKGAKRVGMVGDSITAFSSTQLESALAKKYRRSVNGVPGIDLADALPQLVLPTVATKPDVLVIELGINSARESWDSKDLPYLEATLKAADTVPCTLWVTPTALEPSYYDHLGTGTIKSRIDAMKASLVKRLLKHPTVHLADWGAVEGQHPEWFDADHLHPSAAGKTAYASWLVEQVGALCG